MQNTPQYDKITKCDDTSQKCQHNDTYQYDDTSQFFHTSQFDDNSQFDDTSQFFDTSQHNDRLTQVRRRCPCHPQSSRQVPHLCLREHSRGIFQGGISIRQK